jgi:hypothetical protein
MHRLGASIAIGLVTGTVGLSIVGTQPHGAVAVAGQPFTQPAMTRMQQQLSIEMATRSLVSLRESSASGRLRTILSRVGNVAFREAWPNHWVLVGADRDAAEGNVIIDLLARRFQAYGPSSAEPALLGGHLAFATVAFRGDFVRTPAGDFVAVLDTEDSGPATRVAPATAPVLVAPAILLSSEEARTALAALAGTLYAGTLTGRHALQALTLGDNSLTDGYLSKWVLREPGGQEAVAWFANLETGEFALLPEGYPGNGSSAGRIERNAAGVWVARITGGAAQ